MTVAALGEHDGRLFEVTKEEGSDTDEPIVELRETQGRINSDLTIGVDVMRASLLRPMKLICHARRESFTAEASSSRPPKRRILASASAGD